MIFFDDLLSRPYKVLTHVASIYANILEQNKEGSTAESGQQCNMAHVPLFWNTKIDMAAIGSTIVSFDWSIANQTYRWWVSILYIISIVCVRNYSFSYLAYRLVAVLADFRQLQF